MDTASVSPNSTAAHNDMSPFALFLTTRYGPLNSVHGGKGRRQIKLRAAEEFWNLSADEKAGFVNWVGDKPAASIQLDHINKSPDPFDVAVDAGILIRTDFSDEDAWNRFLSRLKDAEQDYMSAPSAEDQGSPGDDGDNDDSNSSDGDEHMNVDAPESSITSQFSFFKIMGHPSSSDRPIFEGISNLHVLRLLNDVNIVRAPARPPDAPVQKQSNRLANQDGLQEIYTGPLIWIYDAQSNADQSVRLVSQRGETYGSFTADSWRPRVSFLPELQINLQAGAMKIDFGTLDRWDHKERQRNHDEIGTYCP